MDVIFSDEAGADLLEIALYIAFDNQKRANSFVDELAGACRNLNSSAHRHPLVPDYGPGLRRFPFRGYSIYYKIEADEVLVVHILHDSRDHSRLLQG